MTWIILKQESRDYIGASDGPLIIMGVTEDEEAARLAVLNMQSKKGNKAWISYTAREYTTLNEADVRKLVLKELM